MTLHQGQMVRLSGSPGHSYQVVSINEDSQRCWVRRWPLRRHGSPAFAVSLEQVRSADLAAS